MPLQVLCRTATHLRGRTFSSSTEMEGRREEEGGGRREKGEGGRREEGE